MIIGADLARLALRQGQFLGLWRLIGDLGISLAPLLAGVLVDAAGLAAASISVASIGIGGTLVIGLLVAETLRDADARRADPHSLSPRTVTPAGGLAPRMCFPGPNGGNGEMSAFRRKWAQG